MKNIFAIMFCVLVFACTQKQNKDVAKQIVTNTPTASAEGSNEININGKWLITAVNGGPATVYPSGKNKPGINLNFNQIWKGALFEFSGNNAKINIPNVQNTEIGNYKITNNIIEFIGEKNFKQEAQLQLKNDELSLSFTPESYKNTLARNGGGNIEMDIQSNINFILKREK